MYWLIISNSHLSLFIHSTTTTLTTPLFPLIQAFEIITFPLVRYGTLRSRLRKHLDGDWPGFSAVGRCLVLGQVVNVCSDGDVRLDLFHDLRRVRINAWKCAFFSSSYRMLAFHDYFFQDFTRPLLLSLILLPAVVDIGLYASICKCMVRKSRTCTELILIIDYTPD